MPCAAHRPPSLRGPYLAQGTKKQGVSPKRKRQVLDKVRKAAGKQ